MVNRYTLAGICLLVIIMVADAGASPLTLQAGRDSYELASKVDILEDPDNRLTLDDVRRLENKGPEDKGFAPNPHEVISIGQSASAFWFRFKLRLPVSREMMRANTWFLEVGKQGIGALDLYVPMVGPGKIIYRKYEFGVWRPSLAHSIPSRTPVVDLPSLWAGQAYFYLKVRSDVSINFPLRVQSPKGFIKHMTPDLYWFGILFGILLSMILYNFFIYLFLRDKIYLFYVFYISSMFCYIAMLYGHFALIFNPDPVQMRQGFFISCGASWFFGGCFSRMFLNTRVHAPVFDKLIIGMIIVSLAMAGSALLGFTHTAHQLNTFLGIVCPPAAIVAAIRVWQKKFYPAKYFLAAWLVLMTGVVLYSMGGILIPRSGITVYTLAVGAGVEAILLSVALADRIRMLKREKEVLSRNERRLRLEAVTDGMTGLYNHKFFLETLEKEVLWAENTPNPLCLVMLDVDNFKLFNDTHGHPEGDKVLIALADVLFDQVREKDSPFRYGGEEFAVVLPMAGLEDAMGVAERIRTVFSSRVFQPDPESRIQVTVSIGLAELEIGETGQELISRADKALYRAKHRGKNQIVSA